MQENTRSSLFLMEQVIAITVFALFAAVCTAIMINAFFKANDARDLNYALIAAKNGAEAYRIYGSPEEAASSLGGRAHSPGSADIYYDRNWRVCGEQDAVFVLRFNTADDAARPPASELTVERMAGGEIIALTVTSGW